MSPHVAPSERYVPDGFSVVGDHKDGLDDSLWLACTESLASCYAVHVKGRTAPIIASRVASSRVPHALQHAVVWSLGISVADAERFLIVVHRPFGPLLEF